MKRREVKIDKEYGRDIEYKRDREIRINGNYLSSTSLFSNRYYYQYLSFIVISIGFGFILFSQCNRLNAPVTFCKMLLFIAQLAILYIIVQSIKFTKDNEKKLSNNDKVTRYILDSTLFIITCVLLFVNILGFITLFGYSNRVKKYVP